MEIIDINDIKNIALKHNRTVGGINSRIKYIAYKMYKKNTSIEDIKLYTKLPESTILELIK